MIDEEFERGPCERVVAAIEDGISTRASAQHSRFGISMAGGLGLPLSRDR